MTISFKCRRILLTAPGKNYEVSLEPGVNVISGPIYTGKSSLMELIDYVCGAKSPLDYPEIKKCSDVLVQLNVSGEELTIRRSLANSTAKALIYFGTLNEALNETVDHKEVSWKVEKGKPSLSSELLERLGIGHVEIKQAPTQSASELNVFSMRDFMPIMYVDQNRMGISPSFYEYDFAKFIKWKAAFEIVHGLHDSEAANISKLLKLARDEKISLEQELAVTQRFLADSKIPTVEDLEKKIKLLDASLKEADRASKAQQVEEVKQLGTKSLLLEEREQLSQDIGRFTSRENELDRTLTQLGRLRVQYEREFSQLEFLKESSNIVSSIPISRCPACLQDTIQNLEKISCYMCQQKLPETLESPVVEGQLRSLKFRITDLENYTKQLSIERKTMQDEKAKLSLRLVGADKAIESIRKRIVFPKDRRLLETGAVVAQIQNDKETCETQLNLRYRARGDYSNLLKIQERINTLEFELNRRRTSKPSSEATIAKLSNLFSTILGKFRFPWDVSSARLDPVQYLPIVREQDYKAIRSNGALALIECAFQFAMLEFALTNTSLFPKFLMLDSPLNHVGRSATDAEFRDQKIVDSFYEYLYNLHERYKDQVQIVICDNSPPMGVKDLPQIKYSGVVGQGRYGLIQDEYPPDNSPVE